MEYDWNGVLKDAPLKAEHWRTMFPDVPPGLVLSQNTVPPGILVLENFLSPSLCAKLFNECEALKGRDTAVHTIGSGDLPERSPSRTRISESLDIDQLSVDLKEIIKYMLVEMVAPHYGVTFESYEKPEVLRYREGGVYNAHSDTENWDAAASVWRRLVDRDISILIYFNDEYEGGELVFPNFGVSFGPKKGRAIAFPSDHRYLHMAAAVTSGVRYAIVCWALVKSSPRIEPLGTARAIRFSI